MTDRSADAVLPILQRRADIEAALRSRQVVVICGQTGSGKTTQLPQICLALAETGALPGRGIIGHTQPRRLAARSVAARIAEERGEALGGTVGVKVRFHDQTSRRTRIKVMTDGILLAELSSDPLLSDYSTIIIDEAHERSLNIDFLLGYFRSILPKRSDLQLVVTSATIDPRRFSDYFGGPSVAPVIEVSGRTFPVEIRHRSSDTDEESFDRIEFEAVADAVDELCAPPPRGVDGDILVFLPGERDIRLAADALARRQVAAEILPLFSRLTDQQQDRIFHPPRGGVRRVILATNIAETSLTVPGIRSVVDTGLARISRYDAQRKIQRLPIEPISRASADQRAGRCGRVAAGICIRLFGEDSYLARPAFTDPEIRRESLAGVILQMKALGNLLAPIEEFPFLDAPDAAAIKDGYDTLFELGAIDSPGHAGRLTPIGERMARIPLDPRIARMLIGAVQEHAVEEVLVLAAVLSIQDPRERPLSRQQQADQAHAVFRHETSDFLTLLKLWDQYRHAADNASSGQLASWCREHYLSPARMREWSETLHQLRSIADDLELRTRDQPHPPATEDAVHRALLTGLITNVACREGDGSFDYRGVRGNSVQIFPGSVLFKKGPKWIMAAEVVQTTRLYARTIARIDPEWIENLAGHVFQRQYADRHLDTTTGRPSAWERVTLSGIVVVPRRRADLAPHDPAAARSIFIRDGLALAKWDTTAPFMQHNRAVLNRARTIEARLRRHDVLIDSDALVAWFDARVPPNICEPGAFTAWLAREEQQNPDVLRLGLSDVLQPQARAALDPAAFPDELAIGPEAGPTLAPVEYALAPGKDNDGITATVPLESLNDLTPDRAAWLVPGLLPSLVLALMKTLPKPHRAALEARATHGSDLGDVAEGVSQVLDFGRGPLPIALSEAVLVLHSASIPPDEWSIKSLPPHLRLRIRVVDHAGKELAVDRDLPALLQRLEGRIKKAHAAASRATSDRHGITAWDFPDLPSLPEGESSPPPPAGGFVSLMDRGDSVSLVHLPTAREAAIYTRLGIRRLFAIRCREEVGYYIDALAQWHEMVKHYGQLGTPSQLRDHLTTIIADRAFMDGQAGVTSNTQFESRLAESGGRLMVVTREVGDVVARILEPRARVAHRLAGGTSRHWAESVADIREHAAYLMPSGFLSLYPWDRLKHMPRYAAGMCERLFSLKEEGSKAESESLRQFSPHWKKFTAYVAAAMSAERAAAAVSEPDEPATSANASESPIPRSSKAPLPKARRAAPAVNLDAGEWAAQPGRLAASVAAYRWALEEFRLACFAPSLAISPLLKPADVDSLWQKMETTRRG